MNLLERIFPSLRPSKEIATIKKVLENEKIENIRARNRVLQSVRALVDDFDHRNREHEGLKK